MLPQLDSLFYSEVSVEANPRFHAKDHKGMVPDVIGRLLFDTQTTFMCVLDVELPDAVENNLPYDLTVSLFAHFTFDTPLGINPTESQFLPKDTMLSIRTMAVGMCLGAMREFIATITSRGPWGGVLLDTVNAHDVDMKGILAGEFISSKKKTKSSKKVALGAKKLPVPPIQS